MSDCLIHSACLHCEDRMYNTQAHLSWSATTLGWNIAKYCLLHIQFIHVHMDITCGIWLLVFSCHFVVDFVYPCIVITVNAELLQPFLNSKAERMFESDGNNQLVNGISTGLYINQTILLGTMFTCRYDGM